MSAFGDHFKTAATPLADLLGRASELAAADHALRLWLGSPLGERMQLANVRDNIAVLHADSAATLTILRFRQAELIEFLREKLGIVCTGLEININPKLSSS